MPKSTSNDDFIRNSICSFLHNHPLAHHRNGKKYLSPVLTTLAKLKGIAMKKAVTVLDFILCTTTKVSGYKLSLKRENRNEIYVTCE